MIGAGFKWLILSGNVIWSYGLKSNSKISRVFGLYTSIISSTLLLIIGGRSTLVYSIFFAFIIYYYEKRQVNNKKIIIFVMVGIVLAQLYSNARFYLPDGFNNALKSTTEIFINNPASFIPLPSNILEFQSPAKSLMELIEYGKGELLLGRSYISAIGTPIPIINRLTALIGVNPSRWLLSEYHPELLAAGGGAGFSTISEGYMNFGVIGIILHMVVYGRVISYIYYNYKRKNTISSLLLYAGVFPIFDLDGLMIHLASSMYKLFRVYLMPFILYILIKSLRKK